MIKTWLRHTFFVIAYYLIVVQSAFIGPHNVRYILFMMCEPRKAFPQISAEAVSMPIYFKI